MSYKKVLTCDTAGTIAIPSKQAYGTIEFDLYKGADGNQIDINFISENTDGYVSGNTGYNIRLHADESISLRKTFIGSLFQTATSYITNNTWYRIKITRLQSEGVFKDIPTLQVSDMVNGNYTTFTSNGRYGFSATSDGSSNDICGTADEIELVNGKKYLVEFDLKLNSGTAPNLRLFNKPSGGTAYSTPTQTIDGRNSIILTSTGTTTGSVCFRNTYAATDYEISGLTIRQIYDADTFACFIKGGAFGDDDWTLVDVTGGSGSNPVTDNTYTDSEFIVGDLDVGDRIGIIIKYNGVKQ